MRFRGRGKGGPLGFKSCDALADEFSSVIYVN